MLIGDNIDYPDVYSALMPAEQQLGRKLSPAIYRKEDVANKLKAGNAFLIRMMAQPKIFLIGSEHDLPAAQ